jgi:hypothetical protein
MNNILIITAVQFFMIVLTFLGTMNRGLFICRYTSDGQFIGNQNGCYNLVPVYDWIKRCVISIFVVFFIAFLPLFLQELCERGVMRALYRLGKQFLSLSPIFEVFGTQISTHSILSDLSFGGARYIATGRGFATTRISFAILYSRFAGPSIYLGMRTLLMLLYATMTVWIWHLTYFWVTVSKCRFYRHSRCGSMLTVWLQLLSASHRSCSTLTNSHMGISWSTIGNSCAGFLEETRNRMPTLGSVTADSVEHESQASRRRS